MGKIIKLFFVSLLGVCSVLTFLGVAPSTFALGLFFAVLAVFFLIAEIEVPKDD